MALHRQTQRIRFRRGPIAIAFAADLHLGSTGVDYERVFREAQIIAETDGMYLMLVGDLVDNFILAKLVCARWSTAVSLEEEWVLLKKYLDVVADKLLVSVSGNHEKWTYALSGIDYFKEALARVRRDVVYDTDDALVRLEVGRAVFPTRLRHRWLGNSIYNPTHGIERAYRFDGDFIVGVGGHDHAAGLARQFNAGGRTGMAVLCGSYKRVDPFARAKGFARPNGSTAVTVIFDEDGTMIGIDRLEYAASVIRKLR
jgi:hypothetical protein